MAIRESKKETTPPTSPVNYPEPVTFDFGDVTLVCIPNARGERSEGVTADDFVRPLLNYLESYTYRKISETWPEKYEVVESPIPVDRELVKRQLDAAEPGVGTVHVVLHAGQVVLFDSGLGDRCGDPERLSAALEKVGISFSQITQLWLSTVEQRKFVANIKKAPDLLHAHLFFPRIDLDDSCAKRHFGKNRTWFIEGDDTFDKFLSYERCMTLSGGAVVPHVPLSEGQRLAFFGDVVPFPTVQFVDQSLVCLRAEPRGESVRDHKKILNILSRPEFLLAARTLPYPGVGTIKEEDGKYVFTPTDMRPVLATPEAVAEALKKSAAATASQNDGFVRDVSILIRNHSSINVTVDRDPDWDDQILLFNNKVAKKGKVLKPGKEMTVSMEGAYHPSDHLLGMNFVAPGYASFVIGNGTGGLLTVTENDPVDLSFAITEQTPSSFTLVFSDPEAK